MPRNTYSPWHFGTTGHTPGCPCSVCVKRRLRTQEPVEPRVDVLDLMASWDEKETTNGIDGMENPGPLSGELLVSDRDPASQA